MSLVLSNKGKGMQSSSEQPLVGEERYVTTRITAAKETSIPPAPSKRPKAYGTSSKVRLFPAPVEEDTNRSMQDRYS